MTALKKLLGDLANRRVWPVAVALVAALIAVPMMLGRSSTPDPVAAAPPAAAVEKTPTSRAAVTIDESSVNDHSLGGRSHDPFKGPKVPKPKPPATTPSQQAGGTGAASPAGGSEGAAPSTGTPAAPTGGSGGTTPPADAGETNKPDLTISHVTLRLGPIGQLTTYKDVARLSALPSIAKPLFAFTGVLDDGKTVVLLPASVVQLSPESDVQCKPSNASCQTLELTKEDTVFFTIAGDATAVRYQLDILSVQPRSGGSSKGTAAALARHSTAGAAMLRDAHVKGRSAFQGASAYRWLPDRGVLVRTPRHSKAHASANGAAAASAADVDATLPGLAVWHWRAAPGA